MELDEPVGDDYNYDSYDFGYGDEYDDNDGVDALCNQFKNTNLTLLDTVKLVLISDHLYQAKIGLYDMEYNEIVSIVEEIKEYYRVSVIMLKSGSNEYSREHEKIVEIHNKSAIFINDYNTTYMTVQQRIERMYEIVSILVDVIIMSSDD